MGAIEEYSGQELVWVKPQRFKGGDELRLVESEEHSEPLAQFQMRRLGHAEGTIAEGSFRFEETGDVATDGGDHAHWAAG